jgi:hypothetical protein
MAYSQAGLPAAGLTARYEFHYDDGLTDGRGRGLAAAMMGFCDGDYTWLNGFFPTVGPASSHIRVWIENVDAGGAKWEGPGGLIPYDVHVMIGELPLFGTSPVDVARMLVIGEVSEIMMMWRRPLLQRPNEWFAEWDEGSKGEALSRLFGSVFLRTRTTVSDMPWPSVASVWLDGSTRSDWISRAADDNGANERNGCGTLFLTFLHDQLGFTLQQIIDNGALGALADVFENLTGLPRDTAFGTFSDLVNLHYPPGDGVRGVPFDTVFPVPNLDALTASVPAHSWVPLNTPLNVTIALDKVAVVDTTVHLTSSAPKVLQVPETAVVRRGTRSKLVPLKVQPQPAAFTGQEVTLTATYAGRTKTTAVHIFQPEAIVLPPLRIAVNAKDPCSNPFETGTAATARVDNLEVFYDQSALSFAWAVTGATASRLDTPELEIDALPGAGTQVTLAVTVTKSNGLHAHGEFTFTVAAPLSELDELDRRARCKLASTAWVAQFIPPGVPVITGPLTVEQVKLIQQQLAAPLTALIEVNKSLRELVEVYQQQASTK